MKISFTPRALTLLMALALAAPLAAYADTVTELQTRYRTQGTGPFSAAAGEAMWNRAFTDPKTGQSHRCSDCHGTNLRQAGKHERTGKAIAPLAPAAEPTRLTDAAKIEKWFLRNCKSTLGRECTPQEKGDFLSFIQSR
jgi:hypothetical protein